MAAARFDLAGNFAIDRGATWEIAFEAVDAAGNPWDLTGFTARLQFRPGRVTDDARAFSLSTPTLTLTHSAGITLGVGEFSISLTPAQTRALPDVPQVYDLRLYSGGDEYRPIFGSIVAHPEVTVPA